MDDRESIMTERESKSVRSLLKISIESHKANPFSKDDIRQDMAEFLQPYMKDFTPKQNVENCRNLNEMLAYLMKSFLFSQRIRHVDEHHFIFE